MFPFFFFFFQKKGKKWVREVVMSKFESAHRIINAHKFFTWCTPCLYFWYQNKMLKENEQQQKAEINNVMFEANWVWALKSVFFFKFRILICSCVRHCICVCVCVALIKYFKFSKFYFYQDFFLFNCLLFWKILKILNFEH